MSDILTKALEEQDYLMHHGIIGQKWGVRRYQNPDGSLTDEGRRRYGHELSKKINDANASAILYRQTSNKFFDARQKVYSDLDRMQALYENSRYDVDSSDIKAANDLFNKYSKLVRDSCDKDPEINQYYTDSNGKIDEKQRELFMLDNIDGSFISDPTYFTDRILEEVNPKLVKAYQTSKNSYRKELNRTMTEFMSDPDNKKLWNEYVKSERTSREARNKLSEYGLTSEDYHSIKNIYKEMKSGNKSNIRVPYEYEDFMKASPKEQRQILDAFKNDKNFTDKSLQTLRDVSKNILGSTASEKELNDLDTALMRFDEYYNG